MARTISLKETQSTYAVSLEKEPEVNEPVYIERDGKPWAVLVPITEFEQLLALQKLYRDALEQRAADILWCQDQLSHLKIERETFDRRLPELLKTHSGEFVAIRDEQIVEIDPNESVVAARTRARGLRPVLIEQIVPAPVIVEFPSPEEIHGVL